jgi:hypothetical protein
MSDHLTYPRTMSLGTLHSNTLKVIKPIPVTISQFNGGFTAAWDALSEWGCGDTPSEARNDLCRSIGASFFHFRNALLGPALQADFETMKQHIKDAGK